ncbi:MAG TPA: branched-chain amino acid ABC transporter permease [Solirubrobacteraceae bacterium]|jgi:branched-chain amino acid transport system permease protein/neutral amino acid transport system permease protein|nr:branched-chain amino acid ABC transporter permease [Solirubrobacteraceae bacterium]
MHTLLLSIGFGLVTASILAIAAVGFTLQFGVSNMLNLAYGDIMTAAAFAGYLVNKAGAPLIVSILAAATIGSVMSVLVHRYVYRPFVRRGTRLFGLVVVALSVAVIIQNALLAGFGATFFSYQLAPDHTVNFADMTFTVRQLIIMAIAVLVMLIINALLRRTRLGKAMRATSGNPALARACGINTTRVVDTAWLIAGALCGLAGVLLVLNTSSFQSTTGNDFLVLTIAAAMLGGVGQAYGAMIGAVALGVITEVAAAYTRSSFKEVVAFVILVAIILARPQGLLGSTGSTAATEKEAVA